MEITINKELVKSVFILEDNDERLTWFKEIFSSVPRVTICKMAYVASQILSQTKFDLICLDHDLEDISIYDDERQYVTWNTGYEVMKSILISINKESQIIIHSMNPDGALKMLNLRPTNTIKVPFYELKAGLRVE